MNPVPVQIVEGDLLDQDVDVIVNSWNRNIIPWWLLLPQGVSGAIKKRGGKAPFREVAKHGAIPLGGAVLTSAGKLPFKGIIHVAGINMLWRASERSIRDSVRNAIQVANDNGFKSIAFPLTAGRLESGNVCEYFIMMRYFNEIGITEHDDVLYEMGMKEKEHEVYFQKGLHDNRLLPLFEKIFGWGQKSSFNDVDLENKVSVEESKGYCKRTK